MYHKLVKHVIFPLHERLMNRSTYQYLKTLSRLETLAPDQLEILKFEKLKALLIHARDNILFYKKRFSEAGFVPEKLQAIEDIKILPLLTKAEISGNLDEMTWKQCPGGLHRYNTGGSSGQPLIFYFDRRRQAWDAAARALTHLWWGVDIGDRELYLWGSPLEASRQDRVKDIRDRLVNEKLISAFELSREKIPDIVRQFDRFRPKALFGYPSTISLFCRFAKEAGIRPAHQNLITVFTTAETLYPEQKKEISAFFGHVPVADCYGSREGGFVCHQCDHGRYHIMDPNYVVEFLAEGGERQGQIAGEVVLTHLDAWGMPFIRYRTGDVAIPGKGDCSCGRTWSTMASIQGRTTDFIITPDGRYQHALGLIYVVRDIPGIQEFRIIQHERDRVEVLVHPLQGDFPETVLEQIQTGIQKRMGDSVQVETTVTDQIPKLGSGKHRYVISHAR